MIRLANTDGFGRWLEQMHAVGGCAHPIYLAGHSIVRNAHSGEVLRHYTTHHEPRGVLAVRCRNRRETQCAPCSRLHSGDTFHLVRAGLVGGKGTPSRVTDHPRLFVTLTAPSFGAVHHTTTDAGRCHPRRDGGTCEHGRPLGCGLRHAETDTAVGQPLCAACYDYPAHVLWHAHAGALWDRTTRTIRRHLATAGGLTQTALGKHLRVSFAKVAEYQRRGAVHFHAVIRLDGPDGPDGPDTKPPAWATATLLEEVIRSAVAAVDVRLPYLAGVGEHRFHWGVQLDAHPIKDSALTTPDAVAAYIGKYVSKSVTDTGGTDRPVTAPGQINRRSISRHLRTLMHTSWRLGELPDLQHLNLHRWTHTLGFRGHVLSKSRRYSTTYTALRAERAAHTGSEPPQDIETETESAWRYVRSGHTPAEQQIATAISDRSPVPSPPTQLLGVHHG